MSLADEAHFVLGEWLVVMKFLIRVLVVLLTVVSTACSTTQSTDIRPDGIQAKEFTIHCPGDWAECDRQAVNQCGDDDYSEVRREQASASALPNDSWDLFPGPKDGIVTIRCD
jgi:hypothetical protein